MMEFGQFGPDFLPFGPFRSLRPPEIPASSFIAVPSVFITRSSFLRNLLTVLFIAVPFGFCQFYRIPCCTVVSRFHTSRRVRYPSIPGCIPVCTCQQKILKILKSAESISFAFGFGHFLLANSVRIIWIQSSSTQLLNVILQFIFSRNIANCPKHPDRGLNMP